MGKPAWPVFFHQANLFFIITNIKYKKNFNLNGKQMKKNLLFLFLIISLLKANIFQPYPDWKKIGDLPYNYHSLGERPLTLPRDHLQYRVDMGGDGVESFFNYGITDYLEINDLGLAYRTKSDAGQFRFGLRKMFERKAEIEYKKFIDYSSYCVDIVHKKALNNNMALQSSLRYFLSTGNFPEQNPYSLRADIKYILRTDNNTQFSLDLTARSTDNFYKKDYNDFERVEKTYYGYGPAYYLTGDFLELSVGYYTFSSTEPDDPQVYFYMEDYFRFTFLVRY